MALDPVTAVLDIGTKLIERLWPDPTAQNDAKLKLLELQQNGQLAQLTAETELAKGQNEVNKVEAASSNLFVAGWRPHIGWVCGISLSCNFFVFPFFAWVAALMGHPVEFPKLDSGELMSVVMGMLGLAGMRSYEKKNGIDAGH